MHGQEHPLRILTCSAEGLVVRLVSELAPSQRVPVGLVPAGLALLLIRVAENATRDAQLNIRHEPARAAPGHRPDGEGAKASSSPAGNNDPYCVRVSEPPRFFDFAAPDASATGHRHAFRKSSACRAGHR